MSRSWYCVVAPVLLGLVPSTHAQTGGLLRPVFDERVQKWGYKGTNDFKAIPPLYDHASPFSKAEGLAAVHDGKDFYFIDPSGRMLAERKFTYAGEFAGGVAPVAVGGKFAFIDAAGKDVTKFEYDALSTLSEGLGRARVGGRVGYIDRAGKWVIRPMLESAGDFREGLAWFSEGGKFGYIDRTGRRVIPAQFDAADSFSAGLAAVRLGKKYGYAGTSGRLEIEPRFDRSFPFLPDTRDDRQLVARVDRGLTSELINEKGNPIAGVRVEEPKLGNLVKITIVSDPAPALLCLIPTAKFPPYFNKLPPTQEEFVEYYNTAVYRKPDTRHEEWMDRTAYIALCAFKTLAGKPLNWQLIQPWKVTGPVKVTPP